MKINLPKINNHISIDELQSICYMFANAKGWWDKDRTFGDLLCLVHSEISEALESYRARGFDKWYGENNKPEGVSTELADIIIRGVGLGYSL